MMLTAVMIVFVFPRCFNDFSDLFVFNIMYGDLPRLLHVAYVYFIFCVESTGRDVSQFS